ncbi:DinB family protein (plasmid) [Streptomyces sp. CA-294286]|uniref:DinB family protein n=1 Tax=Streptomyces sp. CA-294286 TaxID=3240070 RepID=UPI003D8E7134
MDTAPDSTSPDGASAHAATTTPDGTIPDSVTPAETGHKRVTTPDGRPVPPLRADERTMLGAWLEFHRATLAMKCAGLDDTQARLASVAPSAMTMLGLVRHLTRIERSWFQGVFAGQDVPRAEVRAADGGFALDGDDAPVGMQEALAAWRAEVARSRASVAGASLDDCGTLCAEDAGIAGGDTVSLRWIMVHLIEEYARHNGHADLVRERIDGVTGP